MKIDPINTEMIPMPTPEPLASHIDMARTAVRRADITSAALMVRNVPAHLRNAFGLLCPTPEIEQAFEEVMRTAGVLAGTFRTSSFPDRQQVEREKEAAMRAFDQLETALSTAKPNETARAIGLDW